MVPSFAARQSPRKPFFFNDFQSFTGSHTGSNDWPVGRF